MMITSDFWEILQLVGGNLNKKPVYSHDLKSILKKLDINPGDIVILHASLSSFE